MVVTGLSWYVSLHGWWLGSFAIFNYTISKLIIVLITIIISIGNRQIQENSPLFGPTGWPHPYANYPYKATISCTTH